MKVSCLCLTRNRREWLPKAIACFESQTYLDKELVIVADHFSDVDGLIPPGEINVVVKGSHLTIGEKRNIGCFEAAGDIVCHWDDDDHSEPGRIEDQVNRLLGTGKLVTGYHSMKFKDGEKWWKYHGDLNFALDTSLCYFKSFWEQHRFSDINDGLEANFRSAAANAGQFVTVDGSEFMHASIHPGNTGPRIMTPGSKSWEAL